MSEEDTFGESVEPSEIALRVRSLRESAMNAAATRERLPRTLFWSLFHTEIKSIKKRKQQRRLVEVSSS